MALTIKSSPKTLDRRYLNAFLLADNKFIKKLGYLILILKFAMLA